MKIGIFPMVGDLLHTGHLYALEEAKNQCDYLIVLLNCVPDDKQPVETIFERWSRLKFNKEVDEIIPYQGEADLLSAIKTVKHDVRFVGGDYFGKDFTGRDFEENHNIQLCFISRDHGYSSTSLKNKIKQIN